MKKGDLIFFYDEVTLTSMKDATIEEWADSWKKRILTYYFAPAGILCTECKLSNGFAVVILLCSAIEAIGTIKIRGNNIESGKRFIDTANDLLEINKTLATSLYKHYRNGLIHNGRTNQTRQNKYHLENEFSAISFDQGQVIDLNLNHHKITLVTINPYKILTTLQSGFEKWFNENRKLIGQDVKDEFFKDIEYLDQL